MGRAGIASGLVEHGTDLDTIGKVLGPKLADAGVIAIYDRYDRELVKRVAPSKWSAHAPTLVKTYGATSAVLESAVGSWSSSRRNNPLPKEESRKP